MGTTTSNLGLYKPDLGEVSWGTLRNANEDVMDLAVGAQHTVTGVHKFVTVENSTGYIKFPALTTVERDALPAANGMAIYNTTTGTIQSYESGAWANIALGTQQFSDAVFKVYDDADPTRLIELRANNITTGNTRILTMADADVDLADVVANTTHRTSDGSDHTFIDQDVTSGSSPTFDGANITGVDAANIDIADAGAIITATDVEGALQENRTAIDLNTTHRTGDGSDHADVATNSAHVATTHDYSYISGNDAATNVTAAGLEELTDGSVTALHSHAGVGTDELVGIDNVATPGYIGAAANDGVLRTVAPLSYTDGGDYVTVGVDINGLGAATVASGDLILIEDVDDSNNPKKVTAQSIADLGGGGGGATLTQDVTQATHGFSVGDWVYHNGTIYALADASAAGTAESIGVVSAVAGVNDFTIQFGGRITGLSGLTAGEAHFLSETAGDITATAPTTEGAIIKPVLIADSTTSGYIFNMRGIEITDTTTSYYTAFTNASLSSGVLTVNHNLGHQYCQVQIFNNSEKMVMPDDITLVDADSLTVDLTSFGTISGTWHATVVDMGSNTTFSSLTYSQSFTNSDLSSGVLTVPHSLSDQYPIIQVYDENNQQVVPDAITAASTSSATVDLGSFGTISGTWRVVVNATGGTAAASPTSTTFLQSFVNGDLSSGVLTVNHNLGTQYNGVMVYDNSGDVIQPDDITATSANVTTIDLTSYGTLTGTWQAVIIGPGAYSSNIASDLNLTGQAAEDFAIFDGSNWVAKGGTELVRVDVFGRDMTAATGTAAVTGIGFKPKLVTWSFDHTDLDVGGTGRDDGTRHNCQYNDDGTSTLNRRGSSAASIILEQSAGVGQNGYIQSFDSDGFTINWTKNGSPTGTANIRFSAFR